MAKRAGGMSLTARLADELSHTIRSVVKTRSLVYPRILWRILRQRRLTPGTMRFPLGRIRYLDAVSLRTIYYQIFVEGIYQVDGLSATPTIIDCGGNIGLSVIAFKQRYPQARILTFEADPKLAAVLAQNVKALGLSDVTVEAQAVGGVNGHVLFQPDSAVGGHVVESHGASTPAQAISVPLVRLSDMDRWASRSAEDGYRRQRVRRDRRPVPERADRPGADADLRGAWQPRHAAAGGRAVAAVDGGGLSAVAV